MLECQSETCPLFAESRTIFGGRSDGIPDSRSGLIVGDFWNRVCFQSRPFFLQKIGSRAYWAFQFAAKPGLLDDYVVDVEVSLQ